MKAAGVPAVEEQTRLVAQGLKADRADADDNGTAEKREIWFDGKTLTGCANDLHGPYLGPDGWIYWAKGAFAKQEYTLPNGKKFTTRASHIFRAKPDGTSIEAGRGASMLPAPCQPHQGSAIGIYAHLSPVC